MIQSWTSLNAKAKPAKMKIREIWKRVAWIKCGKYIPLWYYLKQMKDLTLTHTPTMSTKTMMTTRKKKKKTHNTNNIQLTASHRVKEVKSRAFTKWNEHINNTDINIWHFRILESFNCMAWHYTQRMECAVYYNCAMSNECAYVLYLFHLFVLVLSLPLSRSLFLFCSSRQLFGFTRCVALKYHVQ